MRLPFVSRDSYERLEMLTEYLLVGAENLIQQPEFKTLPPWQQAMLKGRVGYLKAWLEQL